MAEALPIHEMRTAPRCAIDIAKLLRATFTQARGHELLKERQLEVCVDFRSKDCGIDKVGKLCARG